jgi:hypothetical protein
MSQTPQQIRLGGRVALIIALFTAFIFGLLAFVEHNLRFFLFALPPVLVSGILGIVYMTQAERIAAIERGRDQSATPKPDTAQSLRISGTVFMVVGAFLLIGFSALAAIVHAPLMFVAAIAPGIVFITIGFIYRLTSPVVK